MSLSEPIITWFVLFHIASSATLLQLLQRDLLRLSHRSLTYDCSEWTKTNILRQWSSQERHFLMLWRLSWFLYLKRTRRGTCFRGKEDCRHASVRDLEDSLLFWKLPQWPHTSWAFTVHEYLPGSRLLLCAINLLHVSHLKVLSSDENCSYENVDHQTWNISYYTVNEGNEVHHPICGVASCGGPASFSAHTTFRILGRDVARQAFIFAEQKSSMDGQLSPLPSRQKYPLHSPLSLQISPSVTWNPQTS